MWPKPDEMAEMLDQKVGHPKAGANTAWVLTHAASLHALHYHQVSVASIHMKWKTNASERRRYSQDLLLAGENLSSEEVQKELDNNAQGILVTLCVGSTGGLLQSSDINDVGLMEDRATLRISSQHIAMVAPGNLFRGSGYRNYAANGCDC